MAKREFIDKNEILNKAQDYGEGQNKLILIDPCYVRNVKPIIEQEIVKPYLEKLKKKIHAKSFESGLMNPILTYAEILYTIDNLLSEESEEE